MEFRGPCPEIAIRAKDWHGRAGFASLLTAGLRFALDEPYAEKQGSVRSTNRTPKSQLVDRLLIHLILPRRAGSSSCLLG